jgi:hypothetical protein
MPPIEVLDQAKEYNAEREASESLEMPWSSVRFGVLDSNGELSRLVA